jgi:thiol:disulfide interchange protein DsbD
MSVLPGIPNPYVEAFAVGLLFGLVSCTATCLPYIASYIAGIGAGFRKGVVTTLIFSIGRITAYALIGSMIGLLGTVFQFVVSEFSVSAFQQYSSYGFSLVAIAIGITILLKSKSTPKDCKPENNKNSDLKKIRGFDVGAFSLGFSRGLVLCPPLAFLLLYSIPFAAPIDSFVVAVLFGFGTALSPMLLLGGVTGWLLNKAPLFRKYVSLAGGGLLIVLGAATLANTIIFQNI